jgi:hypothetical protein
MAEETTIKPESVVTSEAPRSQLSTGDIVGPYQRLANSLDKLGSGLEDLATPLAERAGAQAVTRDAHGNIQVEHMPIFGRAGDAYARAVRVAAMAEGEGAAKRVDIELREKYRDDPQGYQNAAAAYKEATVKQYTAAAGPEVGNAVGQAIDNTTTMTYRGLLNEKERLDLQRAEGRISNGMADAKDDLIAMARGNVPTDDPAFKAAVDKYTTLADERAGNPRLAYTQEQRAADLQKLQGELGAQRYLYHIDQTYKDKGYQAAVDDAKDILENPAYHLTEGQRQTYYAHAMGEIRVNEAIRRQDVGEVQNQLRDLKDRVALGQEVTPDEINGVRNAFDKLNYSAGVAAVDNAFRNKDLHDQFGRQPLADQTRQHAALVGASSARDAYQFFINRGYSKEAAAGIVGNLVFESGMRPTVPGDQGTSFGLAQWHAERFDQLRDYAKSVGKDWRNPQTQLEFVDRELRTTESVAGGLLRTATTPEQAAAVFAQAYERPKGFDYRGRQNIAKSLYDGTASDGSGGPGARSWELANRAATIKTSATRQYDAIKADWDAGKGIADRQGLRDVIDAARETDNADLGAKAEALAQAQDYVDQVKQLPLDEQQYRETEIRRQLELGSKEYAGADMVLKQLQAKTEAIQKGLDKDPIATAVSNFPDKWKTPDPLNISDPQQFAIGLAQRAQIAQGAAHNWRVSPLSVLDDTDVQKVKAALSTPDLAQKAAVWGVLATLPEENRAPTFEKIAKGDPNARAEAAAGSMMATDPEMAKSIMAGLQIMGSKDNVNKQFEQTSRGEGFESDLASKFPSTAFDSETRTEPAGNYATMGQMIKARYTFLAAQANAPQYNSKLLDQAVNDVTGGLVRQNGVKTLPPARGMSQSQFDGVMAGITDTDLAGVTDQNGRQVTANFLRGYGHLEAIGDGKYLVNFAGPGEKPIYAYSGVQRFALDLTGRQPKPPPLMAQPIPFGDILGGARRLIGAPDLRELRSGDQSETPSYGGIRG